VIKRGRVSVGGKQIKDPSFKLDPEAVEVSSDGEKLSWRRYRYFVLNKPAGYITSTEDERDPTIMDILPEKIKKMGLFPVGRLDKDTEGLVLLTDNGTLSHFLLSPKHHVDKTYYLESDLPLDSSDAEAFERGVDIGEKELTLPARLVISQTDAHCAHITLREGKFHQIKRMLNAVGKNVTYLERVAFATLTLDTGLARGEVRELDPEESAALEKLCPFME
jgi:16S rRNA pseudouridine516 synthase